MASIPLTNPQVQIPMMLILFYITLAALALGAMWWLSGYDSRVTGENLAADIIRRTLRILITVFLVAIVFGLHPAGMGAGYGFTPVLMIVPILIGLIWCGCLSEWWSRGFHSMIFSEDKSRYDPNKDQRELGNLAVLLRTGRHEEALLLARQLHDAGDVNTLALETMLTRAGLPWETPKADDPAVKAARLRSQGDFAGAEKILVPFLEQHPAHVHGLLLLLRLYAQDLKQPARAAEILPRLERVPRIPAWQVDYARRSLADWSADKPAPADAAPEVLPESVDELLAQGYAGTAIELLEQKLKDQPGDFDSLLKLAEAQGRYCHNMPAAEKIVRKIEKNPAFTPEQIQTAHTKLAEWRKR
jgi:hypothetical protein